MNTEKISALIYTILGILSGFMSEYLTPYIGLTLPLVFFAGSMYFILKKFKPNKKKKFIAENFLTFILIWAIIWILLFNGA